MQTNEQNLTPKTASSMISLTEANNKHDNLKTNEISQLFNKVYDSNFLSMINELSICIQNFHKYYLNYSNIIKTLFNVNEDSNNNLEQFKYNFNQIDSLSSKFYSDAKLIFKKMKIYRSNIIKNNNQYELKYKHKKSISVNFNIDNNNENDEFKFKKNDNIGIEDGNIKNKEVKENNIIKSNYGLNNNLPNNNIVIKDLKSKIEQLNNFSIKNKDDPMILEFYDQLIKEAKIFEESININEKNKLLSLNEFLNEKKNYIIDFITKIINKSKENNYKNEILDIKDNLSNKIILLEEQNKKLKNEFEKYKSDERIRKKFLENQIISLSKKDSENIKNIKLKDKEYTEKIKNYEVDISNLKTTINNLNNKINENNNVNEKLKNEYQEIIEEKNREINKINEKYEKIINEKDEYYKNELNNVYKIKDNDILKIKNELKESNKKEIYLKEENEKLIESLNTKDIKIKELSSINQEVLKINEIKENLIEQNNNIINEIKTKNSELNDININNNKKIICLENTVKDYENEINNIKEKLNMQIIKNEDINKNYDELNKKYNSNQSEIYELKLINNKYNKTVSELEQENKEINNLLIESKKQTKDDKNKMNKKVEELQDEINNIKKELNKKDKEIIILNKKIEEKDGITLEYKDKYENEIKKNNKLEKKIQDIHLKEEEGNMTEYENKKRKIPNRRSTNNIEIENVEKKFRFLYRTMENFNSNKSRNTSKKNNYSTISNEINNKTKENEDLNNMERKNTFTCLNKNYSNTNIYNKKYKINKNDDYNYEKEQSSSTNNNNIENSIDNINIKLTPENYSFIKCYQLNNKLKWCLFKKKDKKNTLLPQRNYHYRRYSISGDSTTNISNSNSELDSSSYNDFIWIPYKTNKDFIEFGEISFENSDIKSEKGEDINEYKSIIKKLENKIIEKDTAYNKLDNFSIKLINENKKYKNNVEKLIKENVDLNNQLLKYKCDLKNDKNFIGVSFIDDDPESSKFIDDKCCEDILNGLVKEKEKNQIKKVSCYSKNLKNSIDMLMAKVVPSENIRSLLASILRQLGCSDEDIFRLLGNYRGVISIPFSYNKFFNK